MTDCLRILSLFTNKNLFKLFSIMQRFSLLTIIFLIFIQLNSFGQISRKGNPPSFFHNNLSTQVPLIELKKSDKPAIANDNNYNKADATPLEIGYTINTEINMDNSGVWSDLPNGDKIWRLSLNSKGAEALNVYFTNFYLPHRCELYIYNEDKSMVLGAYTSDNNSETGIFSTELVKGDQITIEFIQSKRVKEKAGFTIGEIGHVYQYSGFNDNKLKDFGDSDPCEVNINCVEGDNWRKQKQGVARVMVKVRNSMSWCTGTLLNNVRRDYTPYFYTAEHCGPGANEADYHNWIFYFNYEAANCENSSQEPESNTINGGRLLAKVALSQGSDFKLLKLDQEVPLSFNPYFNGWSNIDQSSPSGVSIHQPWGDVKKISTYTQQLVSTTYEGDAADLSGSFWQVKWVQTTNGHGVTEGGSSGAPLFNAQGLVIGALTGGGASCSNLTAPDYFGKFAHSWDHFATDSTNQLKSWLDPDETGISSISGLDYNQEFFIPLFRADTIAVPVGQSLNFTDLSIGNISEWNWSFEGAVPSTSNEQHPQNIVYPNIGTYDVKLVIRNNSQVDSLTKAIKVVPIVSPVPASYQINVYLGTSPVAQVEFTLYDESGREVETYYSENAIKRTVLDISRFRAGFYFLKIQTKDFSKMQKIAIF